MAKAYKKFPWQSNYLKIPKAIEGKLPRIRNRFVVVASVVRARIESVKEGRYSHLGVTGDSLNLNTVHTIQPPPDSGKYSLWNEIGWEVTHKDLPMIKKTYSWETPNFGDASTYGTHTSYVVRDVYQKTYYEPTKYTISIETITLPIPSRSYIGLKFTVNCILDRHDESFSKDLLFCLNLLQENTGSVDVFSSDATEDDYTKTIAVDWEIFPSGTEEENVVFLMGTRRTKNIEDRGIIEDRVNLLSTMKPKAYIRGNGGLATYIGALFYDDLVVFENIKYGNALYVLYQDWEEVSKRSRRELLKGTSEKYDRFPHTDGWKEKLNEHISDELRRRKKIKKQ